MEFLQTGQVASVCVPVPTRSEEDVVADTSTLLRIWGTKRGRELLVYVFLSFLWSYMLYMPTIRVIITSTVRAVIVGCRASTVVCSVVTCSGVAGVGAGAGGGVTAMLVWANDG